MFAKKYRVGSAVNFGNAKTFNSPLFNLKTLENSLSHNRYRIIISKKVDKRATVRNKIKRAMAQCLKTLLDDGEKRYDLIFYVKKEAITIVDDKKALYSQLLNLLKEVQAIR